MTIGYIGNFRPTFSTENHVAKSLRALGHKVIQYQEDDFTDKQMLESMAEVQPALVLYTRTWGISGDGMWLMKTLNDWGIPTASYHLDLYVGLARGDMEILKQDPFWHTKYVFTVDGDPHSQEVFKEAGINHHYLRAGVFGEECYLAEPDRETYPHDIVFVGSKQYHPEWPYRPLLVDWLQSTYGDRFKRYGHPEITIREHELNTLYASAKIVVGDSLVPNFTHEGYWSDRIYETTGRGGFLIHPFIKGLETDFYHKKTVVWYPFADFAELKRQIDYYLEHEEERRAIQLAGHEHTKANFTYVQRMTEMIKKIEELEGRAM